MRCDFEPCFFFQNMKSIRIRGVVPPVCTPLTAAGQVDEAAIPRIVDHLVAGGCDAAFFLGSTGEIPSLTREARETVIRSAVAAAAGRIPILVGISDNCGKETLALARLATRLGADAVVMCAPSFYELSQDELARYFTSIIPELEVPVLVYNMPWLTGHVLGRECLRAVLEHPQIIGFKDSSGDLSYLKEMVEVAGTRAGTTVLVGNEYCYLDGLRLGANGVVGGGGNIYPELFRSLQDAFDRGDLNEASRFQEQINNLGEGLFQITGRPSSVFCAVKGGMAAMGLCEAYMAPPLTSCTPAQVDEIRRFFSGRLQGLSIGANAVA
ncbi:MAG: dihydrodipicolinate synthase family protein [Verrucomicrobiaceae bacterium]|nr:MAG: dihydrodipicolinate synthase family protein [Verrucomicrobiaceae bacterium]